MSFEWFTFQPLPLSLFTLCIPPDCRERTQSFWQEWTTEYAHSCYKFYRQQLEDHWYALARDFCRSRGLNPDCPTDYVQDYEWVDDWRDVLDRDLAYSAHKEAFESWKARQQRPAEPLNFLWQAARTNDRALFEQWADTRSAANEKWFSFNIPPQPSALVADLKRLSSSDYVRTSYWKRVRAALILINEGMCEQCRESFMSDLPDLWVRRLQYNSGEERYSDLKLLCKVHHLQSTGRG